MHNLTMSGFLEPFNFGASWRWVLPKKGGSRDRNGDKQNNRDMVSNISLYKMTIGIFYLYVISAIFWVTTKGEKHMLYIYILYMNREGFMQWIAFGKPNHLDIMSTSSINCQFSITLLNYLLEGKKKIMQSSPSISPRYVGFHIPKV